MNWVQTSRSDSDFLLMGDPIHLCVKVGCLWLCLDGRCDPGSENYSKSKLM